ncbi:hypothetical protein D3C73_1188360 [compost metagenome]
MQLSRLLAENSRRQADFLLKQPTEIFFIQIADLAGNIIDFEVSTKQQLLSLLHSYMSDIVGNVHSFYLLEQEA